MKLPLSQAENQEIAESYRKAKEAADELANSMTQLLEILTHRTACLGEQTKKALEGPLGKSMSSMFKIKVQNFKISNSNLEGREFKPATTEQNSSQNQP
jgi:coenzyme F420-reducing hydrogenase alpha subunit